MPAYFCLTIRFLQPYSHGRGDGGEPEWPPSPLRAFQALVAASAARWNERMRLAYALPALQWLERLPRPTIVAAVAAVSDVRYRLYVPDNVADKVAKSWSGGSEGNIADYRTEKDVRPTYLSGNAVHYLFPLAGSECPEFEVLRTAARSITHLGWGTDMVAGNASIISDDEAAKLTGERWHPAQDALANGYRVAIQGTLQGLIDKHEAFLNRLQLDGFKPVPPLSAFRVVGYRRATDEPGRPYVPFKLLHPENDRFAYFSAMRANCVAAMTRHATAEAGKHREREWLDSYVHGHRSNGETKPRFSYLPLPSIERREAVRMIGGIRRVMVAELVEAAEGHLVWVRQMLPGQFLTDDKNGDRRAMLAPLNANDWVVKQYVGPCDTWGTVTPVVLPGCDDGKFAKAEKLFFKALGHAGYSSAALADLEFRNVSFWPGGDLALRFQRPDYLKKDRWSVYHVRLRWKQPIKGPLALGAGRHCGLGIFAGFNEVT